MENENVKENLIIVINDGDPIGSLVENKWQRIANADRIYDHLVDDSLEKEIEELRCQLQEKDEYINKLTKIVSSLSELALKLKSLSYDFRSEKIQKTKFSKEVLKLSDKYK